MAVDVCSPRISFSYDVKEPDCMPTECHRQGRDGLLLDSLDFDFCIDQTIFPNDRLSSADELFKNGKILPFENKKTSPILEKENDPYGEIIQGPAFSLGRVTDTLEARSVRSPSTWEMSSKTNMKMNPDEILRKKSLKELLLVCPDEDEIEKEKKQPSSYAKIPFWQFGRSTSLNLERCIQSLNFLSRSNSTGSVPNPNPNPTGVVPKAIKKQNSVKERPIKRTSSSNQYYSFSNYRINSSTRKNYGIKVRINPILNIPQGCISRGSASLFGLSSIFCNTKSKKKKSQ